MRKLILFFCGLIVLACGCGHPKVYKEIFKDNSSCNRRDFSVSGEALRQAVLRTLCDRDFIVEKEDKDTGFILAKRAFQKGKRTILLMVQAKMLPCAEDSNTLFLNAVQVTERAYVADRTRFFMFLIPLPGGGGKEVTTCRENEQTVKDKKFFQDFFSAVEREISVTVMLPEKETSGPQIKITTQGIISEPLLEEVPEEENSEEEIASPGLEEAALEEAPLAEAESPDQAPEPGLPPEPDQSEDPLI